MNKLLHDKTKTCDYVKITLSIFVLLFFATNSFAGPPQSKNVTLDMQKKSINTILVEIQKQTGLNFIFNKADIPDKHDKTIKVTNASIESVLSTILKDTDLTYKIVGSSIAIVKKLEKRVPAVGNQLISVKGRIVEKSTKNPICGATAIIVGTNVGAISDDNGEVRFYAKIGDTIEVSFMGMEGHVFVLNKSDFIIEMTKDRISLDEVVVTGYQTMDRRDVVGAYTSIKMDDIKMGGYSDLSSMLQGQVAGMIVTNSSSRVGSSPKIQIRGASTVIGNQDPIWVVDGVIQDDPISFNATSNMADDLKNVIGNQISWLNPSDIESITVLKDASATAIYGSRASNGVIIVNLKKAKAGRLSINYSTNLSVSSAPNYGQFNLMNSKERVVFGEEAFNAGVKYAMYPVKDINTFDGALYMFSENDISQSQYLAAKDRLLRMNTDWLDVLTRAAFSHNHIISVNGASDIVDYNLSVGYNNDNGQEINNRKDRITSRASVGVKLHEKVRVNFSINASSDKLTSYVGGIDPLSYATSTSRALPLYNEDNTLCFLRKTSNYLYNNESKTLGYNIMNELENSSSKSKNNTFKANLTFKWDILKWLTYEFDGGYSYANRNVKAYQGEKTFEVANSYRGYDFGTVVPTHRWFSAAMLPFGGVLTTDDANQSTYTIQNKLLINHSFNHRSRLNVMLGTEVRSTANNSVSNTVYGYVADRGNSIVRPTRPSDFKSLGYSTMEGWGLLEEMYNGKWQNYEQTDNFFSLFATAAYSYKDRYVINANIRNDVSNRFGQDANKRVDPTYSFGLLWRVSEENFVKYNVKWLTMMSLRATYGIQGNVLTNISPDLILKQGMIAPIFNEYYSTISSIPNPLLSWEKTRTWNFGLDLQLFNAVTLTADYYTRRSNAIVARNVPFENGVRVMNLNGGLVHNNGVEATIGFIPVNTKDFGFSFSINSSRNWNETGSNNQINTIDDYLLGSENTILKDGYPLGAMWAYDFTGLNPENGKPMFNFHDERYDENDLSTVLSYVGQSTPNFTGGVNLNFRYKNLTLGVSFAAILGGNKRLPSAYENFINYGDLPDAAANLNKDLNKRWRNPGDEAHTTIPSLPTGGRYVKTKFNETLPYLMAYENSTALIVNSSFLRCRDINLTYRFGEKTLNKIGLKELGINFSVSNPFVVASNKFNGFDPELNNSIMPKMFTLGVNIGF